MDSEGFRRTFRAVLGKRGTDPAAPGEGRNDNMELKDYRAVDRVAIQRLRLSLVLFTSNDGVSVGEE